MPPGRFALRVTVVLSGLILTSSFTARLAVAASILRSQHRSRLPYASTASPEPEQEPEQDDVAAADFDEAVNKLSDMLASRRASTDDHADIETNPQALLDAGHVWALLFNPGSEEEGIYSRRLGHTGQNLVLTFEEEDDAARYAEMLIATDFPSASTVQVEARSLVEFCEDGGHMLGLVRHGSLIMPPEETVEEFDWAPPGSRSGDMEKTTADMSTADLDASRRSLEAMFGLSNESENDTDDST